MPPAASLSRRPSSTITGCRVLALFLVFSAMPAFSQTVIPAPSVNGEGNGAQGGMDFPDPYLWHVTGLKPGQQLPVLSGAGPNFRIIHALTEGTPVDMQNCMESRGGYWCRIATVDRPRISGWVDGRYVVKTGGDPPGMIGGVPVDPVIELPVGKGNGGQGNGGKGRGQGGQGSSWQNNGGGYGNPFGNSNGAGGNSDE
ncbi:hypothetical protein HGO34_17425 [Agrobacterium vitis]|uniref:SH3 domain-containing protein n=1 Tax=Agrobacterium vitis TaxID=373 RepID=A0AAE4WG87_AGRVI|nr:hypothetical protein [Agrobacterium vitis]MCF1497604.1 hypothetical protein [Allorhizobium sp. Av2]MCM2441507.1 hypothetical protein [Agrobacterium vitis]MUZ59405.1 hypothetical protein [Agrobacterium vitis]MVA67924.1 hypothetical protein [Agrobacterium vitis]MVA89714.1 hypothetical protein [Agrobacterium vitis]